MAGSHLFRMGKVKGKNGVLTAAKHNKRELQSERGAGANIDAFRTSLNYSLTDPATAEQIDRTTKVLMVKAGIDKTRKNQVMALEIIFSLPINRHQQDTRPFFRDCMKCSTLDIQPPTLRHPNETQLGVIRTKLMPFAADSAATSVILGRRAVWGK